MYARVDALQSSILELLVLNAEQLGQKTGVSLAHQPCNLGVCPPRSMPQPTWLREKKGVCTRPQHERPQWPVKGQDLRDWQSSIEVCFQVQHLGAVGLNAEWAKRLVNTCTSHAQSVWEPTPRCACPQSPQTGFLREPKNLRVRGSAARPQHERPQCPVKGQEHPGVWRHPVNKK